MIVMPVQASVARSSRVSTALPMPLRRSVGRSASLRSTGRSSRAVAMMGGGEDDGPKITRENEKECVHPLGSSGFAGREGAAAVLRSSCCRVWEYQTTHLHAIASLGPPWFAPSPRMDKHVHRAGPSALRRWLWMRRAIESGGNHSKSHPPAGLTLLTLSLRWEVCAGRGLARRRRVASRRSRTRYISHAPLSLLTAPCNLQRRAPWSCSPVSHLTCRRV
jgi:hypothetical protein